MTSPGPANDPGRRRPRGPTPAGLAAALRVVVVAVATLGTGWGCVEVVLDTDGGPAPGDVDPGDGAADDTHEPEVGGLDWGTVDTATDVGDLGPSPDGGPDDGGGPGDGGSPDAIDDRPGNPDSEAGDGGSEEADTTGCAGGCAVAPDDCYEAPGVCQGGECVFSFRGVGAECDDDDPCTLDDRCDALGGCSGIAVDCERDHAEGGVCVDGACEGWTCVGLWGDCNDDMNFDGCETPLTTSANCGLCRVPCTAGAHADASCTTGECVRTCRSPWENCDGSWGNGCEIPTGVPNQCDANGLNAVNGCWTAWCGSSSDPDARNFGTWFCFECTTCHVPSSGRCQWCSHTTGTWYPDDACACGSYQDLVCEL